MKVVNGKHHFMVDLETLSSQPNAHILETALVNFNPVTGSFMTIKLFISDMDWMSNAALTPAQTLSNGGTKQTVVILPNYLIQPRSIH